MSASAEAVKGAVTHGLFILTGGPGTGKTTTIRAMIRYFEEEGYGHFSRRSDRPRGKADDARPPGMRPAPFIACWRFPGRRRAESRCPGKRECSSAMRNNPLETDVLIIDEMSMVDITLMYALVKAVGDGTRLISGGGCEPASQCRTGQCAPGSDCIRVFSGGGTAESFPSGQLPATLLSTPTRSMRGRRLFWTIRAGISSF